MEFHDIVIVGGGPAGLTAAVYALRAGKTVLVIEKSSFGGQIAFSPKVENIPGTQQISGSEFAEALTEQALNLGADVELEKVTAVEKIGGAFRVTTEEGGSYLAKAVILAVGVKHRRLGLPGEEELIGNGISFCAVCDGAFYAGQEVVMVGGGNSALQEALLLSEVCKQVTIVQNLDFLTGEQALIDAVMKKENIRVWCSKVVGAYVTENGVLTGVQVQNPDGSDPSFLRSDGVFLAVGLEPENTPFAQLAELNNWGYFDSAEDCCTKTEGLYVAGDCRSKRIRQVVTAASDGACAAMAACRFIG